MNLTRTMERIRKRMRYGSLSRIAEACNVSPATVSNWFNDDWTPGERHFSTLAQIASGQISLAPKKPGPKKVVRN